LKTFENINFGYVIRYHEMSKVQKDHGKK